MINETLARKYCKEDIRNIENYIEAVNDTSQTWDCHHKLEIRNDYKNSKDDLMMMNLYVNRPACELIFLTSSEHIRLHMKGKIFSDEHRNNLSAALKGRTLSETHKTKLSVSLTGKTGRRKGKHSSEETRKKQSESLKGKSLGKHWYNNGIINTFAKSCPDGFVEGMIRKEKN